MTDTIIPVLATDTIIHHPIAAIVANRYQRRHIDVGAADINDLANNIHAHGLQNPVIGRWHPDKPGTVELVSGHRRHAAFKVLAREHTPRYPTIPLIIRELTDRQMFEACAVENAHRLDLSGIEKAISLRDYLSEFKVGQAEAGALFGVGQAAVSHLLRLLKLPQAVQDMVDSRELAERTARALVPLVDWDADVVVKIAKAALKEDPDERDEAVEFDIGEALRKKAPRLNGNQTWPLEWPATPLPIPGYQLTPGTPAEAPACTGCKFNLTRDREGFCLRPACYAAKGRLWPLAAVATASKALGIPAAAQGEEVTVVFDGSHYDGDGYRHLLAKAVRAKRPELRLVPAAKRPSYDYQLLDVTGSKFVCLAATSKAAIDAWLDESKGKAARAPIPKNETPAAKALRVNGEAELKEERAIERGLYNKAKADGLYLFDRAAHLVADKTVAGGGLLVWAALHPNVLRSQVEELNNARRATESAAKLSKGAKADVTEGTPTELDHARRKYIAYTELVKDVAGYDAPAKLFSAFGKMVADLAKCALDSFGVALPADWDAVPIHHTAYNCWQCGAFAGNPKGLTKAEKADGWTTYYELPGYENRLHTHDGAERVKGAVLAGVLCPVHRGDAGVPTLLSLVRKRHAGAQAPALPAEAHLARSLDPLPAKSKPAKDVRSHTSAPTPAKGAGAGPSKKQPARQPTSRRPAATPQRARASKAAKKGGRK